MDKTIKWFEDNWKNIGLVVAIGAIVYLMLPQPAKVATPTKDVKVAQKKLTDSLVKNAECSPSKTEQIIQLASLPTLKDMLPANSVVLDLDTFKRNKTEVKGDKVYTYYYRHGENSEYYTIATPKPKELIKVEAKE